MTEKIYFLSLENLPKQLQHIFYNIIADESLLLDVKLRIRMKNSILISQIISTETLSYESDDSSENVEGDDSANKLSVQEIQKAQQKPHQIDTKIDTKIEPSQINKLEAKSKSPTYIG